MAHHVSGFLNPRLGKQLGNELGPILSDGFFLTIARPKHVDRISIEDCQQLRGDIRGYGHGNVGARFLPGGDDAIKLLRLVMDDFVALERKSVTDG